MFLQRELDMPTHPSKSSPPNTWRNFAGYKKEISNIHASSHMYIHKKVHAQMHMHTHMVCEHRHAWAGIHPPPPPPTHTQEPFYFLLFCDSSKISAKFSSVPPAKLSP
jgi:hypothetical protein